MKSLKNLGTQLAATTLLADDVLEFHAGRLLMLLRLCGTAGRIDGLTKMAKLDFLVRYPRFFEVLVKQLGKHAQKPTLSTTESSMVRYHYGPWDTRYYQVLAYLEAKGLITVSKKGRQYKLALTESGTNIASQLTKDADFEPIVAHMKEVKKAVGDKAGSTLKKMIYEAFSDEVVSRSFGEVIR